MNDPLCHSFVQHLLVPLLKAFGFRDLLVHRVAVEDVVVPLARRAGPDVTSGVTVGQKEEKERLKDCGRPTEVCIFTTKALTPASSHTPGSR